jgi:hypothetical protein
MSGSVISSLALSGANQSPPGMDLAVEHDCASIGISGPAGSCAQRGRHARHTDHERGQEVSELSAHFDFLSDFEHSGVKSPFGSQKGNYHANSESTRNMELR